MALSTTCWRRSILLVSLFALSLDGACLLRGQDAPPLAPPGGAGGAPGGFGNFSNAPVNTVLDFYEGLAGKRLVRDVNLNGVPPVSINANGLSKADELRLIEATLLLNGVALVPVDDTTLKVITVGTNKNPRSEGVKIYANAADLPKDDQVVSYYMPLSFISPAEVQGIFKESVPTHLYGAYVPVPSAQAIVLTENADVIRQLIALKELIDVPPARVVSEFVQLNRADAAAVSDLLNNLLDGKTGAAGATGGGAAAAPAGGAGVIVPANLGNREPLSNERNLISGGAQIIPDPRSNRLLIITRPVNMPFLKQLIAQLDQPDIFMVPQRRPLKYVLAQDILPALESALAHGKDEETAAKDDLAKAAANSKANGGQTGATGGGGGGGGGGGTSGSGTSASAITPQLQAPPENNVPTVVSIGKTRLMADNRSNSIIVFGSPDITARVFDMIDQLDRKPLQVMLATVIGQLTVSEGEEFGIDLLQKYTKIGSSGIAGSSLTTGQTASTGIPNPGSLTAANLFPLASGLTLYGTIAGTVDAYVRALETTNRFKVISRPSVYTTNNKLAVIANGSQVPVPGTITSGFTGSTAVDQTGLTTSANVVYQNVLLQLDIIPLINADHEVTLKIRQTNNSLGANNVISGNNVPTINTQEINTEVTVPDKSTVVIGGLISDTTKRDTTGVPLLSDIPLVGYLFKDTTKSKERDELIIMIQPNVIANNADQIASDRAEERRTILGRDALESANGFTQAPTKTLLNVDSQATGRPVQAYNSKTGAKIKPATTTTTTTTTSSSTSLMAIPPPDSSTATK